MSKKSFLWISLGMLVILSCAAALSIRGISWGDPIGASAASSRFGLRNGCIFIEYSRTIKNTYKVYEGPVSFDHTMVLQEWGIATNYRETHAKMTWLAMHGTETDGWQVSLLPFVLISCGYPLYLGYSAYRIRASVMSGTCGWIIRLTSVALICTLLLWMFSRRWYLSAAWRPWRVELDSGSLTFMVLTKTPTVYTTGLQICTAAFLDDSWEFAPKLRRFTNECLALNDSGGCDGYCARLPLVIPGIGCAVLLAGGLWQGLLRDPSGCCQSCGYSLTGNTSGVCPECGTAIPAIV